MPQSPTAESAESPDVDPQWLQEVVDSTQALIVHGRLLRFHSRALIQSAVALRERSESVRLETERVLLNLAA